MSDDKKGDQLSVAGVDKADKADWTIITGFIKDGETYDHSREQRVQFYNKNADIYEDHMFSKGYTGHIQAAEALHRNCNGDSGLKVLDVGGGSGLVVQALRKLGPYNNVDGLDAGEKLLTMARDQGVYKYIYPQLFYVGCGIPHNSYDAITCSGSFLPGHLRVESIQEMCNVVKPGGLIVISMRQEYLIKDEHLRTLRPTINALQEEGKLTIVEDREFDNYYAGLTGWVVVLRKSSA